MRIKSLLIPDIFKIGLTELFYIILGPKYIPSNFFRSDLFRIIVDKGFLPTF